MALEQDMKDYGEQETAHKHMQAPKQSALATQIGGEHYKGGAIQPVQFSHSNGLGFVEGSVVKYVTRYKQKGGKADLLKARHLLDILIELEFPK